MQLAEEIKERRYRDGLSLTQLSKILAIDRTTIWRVEVGHTPTLPTFVRLIEYLGAKERAYELAAEYDPVDEDNIPDFEMMEALF